MDLKNKNFWVVMLSLVLLPVGMVYGLDTSFTYQGQLLENTNLADGTYDFQFKVFDLLAGGVQQGVTDIKDDVVVTDGQFTVVLDFGDVFDGTSRWLGIEVRDGVSVGVYTLLTPRQPLTATPYALFALKNPFWEQSGNIITNSNSGFVGINRDYLVGAEWFGVHAPVNSGYGGMYVTTEGATGKPFYGYHTGTERAWHYLDGSDGDWHLYVDGDRLTVTDEGNVGIGTTSPAQRLHVRSSGDKAIFGEATSTSNAVVGVHGATNSTNGLAYGVMGEITNAAGVGVGVYGKAPFYGVTGIANNTSGLTYGVNGQAASQDGFGVFGENTSTSGSSTGIKGVGGVYGVMGVANNASGLTYGVYGEVNSSTGYGGYFLGRGYFEFDLGVGTVPSYRLDAREASTSANVVHLERVADAAANADLLELQMGVGSNANSQFIECQLGAGDIKFRVWGDGDVSADGVFTAGGADFAEMITASEGVAKLEPGDVMVIDISNPRAVVRSTTSGSTLVAGIYSTKPGVIGSPHDWDKVASTLLETSSEDSKESPALKTLELGKMINEIPMAVVGIVPCKVTTENGPIKPGDLLVTSSKPGYAMRDDDPKTGSIVGKALGTLDEGYGVIEILVTLQ